MKRFLLFVFVSLLAASSVTAQSPHELFQQALRLESSQGDLEGAIALYERIGASFGSDRALGARALFRMGQVYETLGRIEAERAYRRVVADFADQTDTVGQARERLAGLVAAEPVEPPKPLIHPELVSDKIAESSFSKDGKYFVNTNWVDYPFRLGYQEVGKDEVVYVSSTNDPTPISGRFSFDNRYIAYATDDDSLGHQYIKVFDTADRTTRTLRTNDENWYFEVYDWTSDGSAVLALLQQYSGGVSDLALIDVATGETRYSQRAEGEFAWRACLLEDRYVLYENLASTGNNLRVVDLQNGDQSDFLSEASGKTLGGCSSQRNRVLIQTDLFGESKAWIYSVSGGRPAAEPEPLREIGPKEEVIGFTDDGDVFVVKRNPPSTTLYPFSAERGTIAGRGDALPDLVDFSGQVPAVPSWTTDGNRLAYPIGFYTVWMREQDGKASSVMLDDWILSGVQWSADGSAFLTHHWDSDTGTRTPVRIDAASGELITGSSDEAMVFASRKNATALCLNRLGLESGEVAELYCYEDNRSVVPRPGVFGPRVKYRRVPATLSGKSGRLLVYSADSSRTTLFTHVDFDSGTSKLLLEGSQWSDRVELLPDNSSILALTKDGLFYRVPFDEGPPEPWFVSFTDVNEVQTFGVHPTENQILIMSTPRVKESTESAASIRVLRGVTDRAGSRE